MVKITDAGCANLVNGIIIQAGKDYEVAYKILHKKPKANMTKGQRQYREQQLEKAHYLMNEAVKFFHSDEYKGMTDIDGDVLLNEIKRKCEKRYK